MKLLTTLLATLALLVGCNSGSTSSGKMIFLGDSLTAAGEGGYVDILAHWFVDRFYVHNAGCGVSTSYQWAIEDAPEGFYCFGGDPMNLWNTLVAPMEPAHYLFILLGTNDSDFHVAGHSSWHLNQPIEPHEYELNIRELVERASAERIVLLFPPDPRHVRPARKQRLRDYRAALTYICTDYIHVECGPNLKKVLDERGDFEDDLHASKQGHSKIADAILSHLGEI